MQVCTSGTRVELMKVGIPSSSARRRGRHVCLSGHRRRPPCELRRDRGVGTSEAVNHIDGK